MKRGAGQWLIMLAAAGACTDTYLYDERRLGVVPADRTVALEGRFCTIGPNEIVRPIKILLAFDASLSMNVTDPNGTRVKAILQLMDSLPDDPEIYVSVMVFAGSTSAFLTKSGKPQFEKLQSYTQADKSTLAAKLLAFADVSNSPNRDSTDFVKPLAEIYSVINYDISVARSTGSEARALYSAIFLSDGHPTNDQDNDLLCGDSVLRIRQLREMAEDVRFNTVHVFNPLQPLTTFCELTGYTPPAASSSCKFPRLPPGACPALVINQDAERLERMAALGGGDFRDFRNNEPINFLSFKFGQVRRAYQLKELVASNLTARPNSALGLADTDRDRLTDAEEVVLQTDPFEKDTDGDGFSDGVEAHFAKLGAPFNPAQIALPDGGGLDPGCPVDLRGYDSDCDGLLDCDEQLMSNAERLDSDDDGIPDAVEWQLGTDPNAKDLELDPDGDGIESRAELRLHTDPLAVDGAKLSLDGYRYKVEADGPVDAQGRQCYRFRVDNILLVDTLADTRDGGTHRGAGFNELYFAMAMVATDDTAGRTLVRQVLLRTPRFPVGGIRSPVDGVLRIEPDDLVDRCGR